MTTHCSNHPEHHPPHTQTHTDVHTQRTQLHTCDFTFTETKPERFYLLLYMFSMQVFARARIYRALRSWNNKQPCKKERRYWLFTSGDSDPYKECVAESLILNCIYRFLCPPNDEMHSYVVQKDKFSSLNGLRFDLCMHFQFWYLAFLFCLSLCQRHHRHLPCWCTALDRHKAEMSLIKSDF